MVYGASLALAAQYFGQKQAESKRMRLALGSACRNIKADGSYRDVQEDGIPSIRARPGVVLIASLRRTWKLATWKTRFASSAIATAIGTCTFNFHRNLNSKNRGHLCYEFNLPVHSAPVVESNLSC
jgi:hypothetical protein